jgi:hypothetical protein
MVWDTIIVWKRIAFFCGSNDRDVFNEKPSKEELISATQVNYLGHDVLQTSHQHCNVIF